MHTTIRKCPRRYSGRGYFERVNSYRLSTRLEPRMSHDSSHMLPRITWTDRKGRRTTGASRISAACRDPGALALPILHDRPSATPPPRPAATCTAVHVVDERRYEFSVTIDDGADLRFRAQKRSDYRDWLRALRRGLNALAHERARNAVHPWLGADDESGRTQCCVCLDAARTHAYASCGHLCVCEVCGIESDRCPVCRVQSAILPIYIS